MRARPRRLAMARLGACGRGRAACFSTAVGGGGCLGRVRAPGKYPEPGNPGKRETCYVAEGGLPPIRAQRGLFLPDASIAPSPHVLQPACPLQETPGPLRLYAEGLQTAGAVHSDLRCSPYKVSPMAVPQNSNETSYLLPPNSKDWEEQSIPDFVYGQKELILEGIQWPRTAPSLLDRIARSRFDSVLCSAWRQRMELGLFRYCLGKLQTQTLPGPVGFVAQLNVERGVQRRRPQNIQSVKQAFDPEQFNFNKIRPGEVLFRLLREPDLPGAVQQEDIYVMINVSPLEWGHVLLVPAPTRGLPQRLLPAALRAGIEAVLLSSHPGFRVGFNSLGGLASVNHLHLHGYYLAHRLPVEGAPSEPLDPGGHLHLLQALPAPGFLFYTSGPGPDLEALVGRVCRATDYLTDHEIAHNLFVTRGAPPGKTSPSSALTGVRVILWARKSNFGVKEGEAFNVALCELAGHLPIKTSQDFGTLTEAAALALIQDCLLPPAQAEEIQATLVDLIAKDEQ